MNASPSQPKWMTIVGWTLGLLCSALLFFSASMKFAQPAPMMEQFGKFGYSNSVLVPLGITEITCTLLYLFPPTRVLGAVLLAGYLGGATATHVRIGDPFVMPVLIGVLVWLGLFLRDARVRALLPLARS